jgi:hypothetical protein
MRNLVQCWQETNYLRRHPTMARIADRRASLGIAESQCSLCPDFPTRKMVRLGRVGARFDTIAAKPSWFYRNRPGVDFHIGTEHYVESVFAWDEVLISSNKE